MTPGVCQDLRVGTVDEEVVRAHIVPDVLLFTRPQLRRVTAHPTLQYNSSRRSFDLRVMAKVDMRNNGESQPLLGREEGERGTV